MQHTEQLHWNVEMGRQEISMFARTAYRLPPYIQTIHKRTHLVTQHHTAAGMVFLQYSRLPLNLYLSY